MNDEQLIWESYKLIIEAHRNIPNIRGERPFIKLLNIFEFKSKKLEDIYNKIKIPKFKEQLEEFYYTDYSKYLYNHILDYLESLFDPTEFNRLYSPKEIVNSIKTKIKYKLNFEALYYSFNNVLNWKYRQKDNLWYIEIIGDREISDIEKYIISLIPIIDEYYNFCNQLVENSKEDEKLYADYNKGVMTMKLNDIEEAYHASINAKDIYENGFNVEGKHGGGLGTGNQPREISFTLDLYVAKEIAKSLKICWLIANNKYKWRDFINYLEHKRNPEYSVKDILHELWKNGSLDENHKPKDISGFLEAYTKSFYFLQEYNPGFAFVNYNKFEEMLKSIPYSNIGIVKCNIKTEEKLFKTSEMEIKVYPEDVLEITQLIT
jgi:hypothetical protein